MPQLQMLRNQSWRKAQKLFVKEINAISITTFIAKAGFIILICRSIRNPLVFRFGGLKLLKKREEYLMPLKCCTVVNKDRKKAFLELQQSKHVFCNLEATPVQKARSKEMSTRHHACSNYTDSRRATIQRKIILIPLKSVSRLRFCQNPNERISRRQ